MQTLDLADILCRYGSLASLGNTGIDIREGMLLWRQSLCHGFVIGGTEDAEIEGTGVEGCLIMQRSAVLPVLQQQDDKEVHELE